MNKTTTVFGLVLLAVVAALLWRIETRLEPMAELARVNLSDREEARRAERERSAAAERAQAEARAREDEAAAAAQQRARDAAARDARQAEPVKPGEVVPEIYLDNHSTIRGAVVIAVQGTSVSFKVGARLYNIPTEQLPEELQARVRRMFPLPPEPPVATAAEAPAPAKP